MGDEGAAGGRSFLVGENLLVSDFWFPMFCSSNISFNEGRGTLKRASHGERHDLSDFINFQNLCDSHRVEVYPQARA